MKTATALIVLLLCIGINAKSCLEEAQELATNSRPLLGAFKPICQPNGLYADTQNKEGYFYCVVPETGEEILGTRLRFKKPKSCKVTPCLMGRHQALLKSKKHMVGQFQPQCEEDGSFKKMQCHASTGYCYCVTPETGVKVLGTEIRGTPNCDVQAKKCLDQVKALEAKPKLYGAFKPVCQPNGMFAETQSHEGYFYCVVPETGEKILGTSVRSTKPKSCKATPCLMQRHQGLLNTKNGMVGHLQPKCEEDGSFKKVQCHGSTGFCFCVVPETGKKISGTEVRGTPTNCEAAGTKNAQKCLDKVTAMKGKKPLMGAFKPVCQPNGLFAETQCHEAYCYCVIPETGEEILGTRVRFNKPKSCKATPCFIQRHHALKDSNRGMVGQFQPKCEDDGSFSKTQCHSSTGYCFCVIPETGEKVLGTEVQFNKPKNCDLTACVRQRHESLKSNLLGVFRPACDDNGAYIPMQCKEGICYCVFTETGEEVMGTRLKRGQKPVSCEVTKCVKERHDVLSLSRPLLGAFTPQCSENGKYEPTQCHEGTCYCVFTETGEEVLGTMTRFSKPKSCTLTPCVMVRHKGWKLARIGLLGVPISRCDADGKYQKVQCRKGMCWCVNPDTGLGIEGTSVYWTVPNC